MIHGQTSTKYAYQVFSSHLIASSLKCGYNKLFVHKMNFPEKYDKMFLDFERAPRFYFISNFFRVNDETVKINLK